MKNICKIIVVLLFLSACKKQKNIAEFEQFKGTWKLDAIGQGYRNKDLYTVVVPVLSGKNFEYLKGLTLVFNNDGYISFAHDTYGKETWRIVSYSSISIDSPDLSNIFSGYKLKLKNKFGKTFILFLAMNSVTGQLISELWYKGHAYKKYNNSNGAIPVYGNKDDYFGKYGQTSYEYYYLGWYEKI